MQTRRSDLSGISCSQAGQRRLMIVAPVGQHHQPEMGDLPDNQQNDYAANDWGQNGPTPGQPTDIGRYGPADRARYNRPDGAVLERGVDQVVENQGDDAGKHRGGAGKAQQEHTKAGSGQNLPLFTGQFGRQQTGCHRPPAGPLHQPIPAIFLKTVQRSPGAGQQKNGDAYQNSVQTDALGTQAEAEKRRKCDQHAERDFGCLQVIFDEAGSRDAQLSRDWFGDSAHSSFSSQVRYSSSGIIFSLASM